MAPHTPRRSEPPGKPGALLCVTPRPGAPKWPPKPPPFESLVTASPAMSGPKLPRPVNP